MTKFRKKPVVVEAIQVLATNKEKLKAFMGDACKGIDVYTNGEVSSVRLKTPEGTRLVERGDWIIKSKVAKRECCTNIIDEAYSGICEEAACEEDLKEEFSTCREDIFGKIYEEVCILCEKNEKDCCCEIIEEQS